MKKREFIKTSSVITMGVLTAPLISCKNTSDKKEMDESIEDSASNEIVAFDLPPLPYDLNALEPYIDERTMGIHHGKHHAGYVNKLNAALKDSNFSGKDLTTIVKTVTENDTAIRNNGGGHYNHSMFWTIMKPGGGEVPSGKLADAINSNFGSFDEFKTLFAKAAATRFGSGWGWLSVDAKNKLFISSTPNQDNPLMKNLVEQKGTPILGIDVWEHAYYLNYQNRRTDYIDNFFNIINWEQVAKNYDKVG
jgi:Fe-Mn family superoxide dismutase